MSTDDAIEYAARHLPTGWTIAIEVEEGYACIVLWDDTGEKRILWDFERFDHPTSDRIVELVGKACELAKVPR